MKLYNALLMRPGKDTGRVAYIGAVMDAEIFRDYSQELHLEVVLESTEKALKALDCYRAANTLEIFIQNAEIRLQDANRHLEQANANSGDLHVAHLMTAGRSDLRSRNQPAERRRLSQWRSYRRPRLNSDQIQPHSP